MKITIFRQQVCRYWLCPYQNWFKLKSLYSYFVSIVFYITPEYGSVLWDSSTFCGSIVIELFQRKFLSLVAFRFNISHSPRNYSPINRDLRLSNLADRWYFVIFSSLCNLISGKIDFTSLLSLFSFRIPLRRTHSSTHFLIPLSYFNNYFLNSLIYHLMCPIILLTLRSWPCLHYVM